MIFWIVLIVFCCVWIPPALRNKERYKLNKVNRSEAPGQFVELTHGAVHYELTGNPDGPLVVLVHGFSAPSYMWDKNVPALVEAGYRVLRFDLYGRGYSARPSTKYDTQLFVDQIQSLTSNVVGEQPFHIVGLSMGGAITSAFISQFPSKILSVIYLAPFNKPIDIGPLVNPIIGQWLGYTFFIPSLAKSQLNDLVQPELQPDWVSKFERQMQFKGFRRAIISSGRYVINKDPTLNYEQVGKFEIEKLLLWGTSDKVITIDDALRVQRLLGEHTSLVVLKDAGHVLQYEHYTEVNSAMIEHLNHVSSKGV